MNNATDKAIADHEQSGMIEPQYSGDLVIPADIEFMPWESDHSDYDTYRLGADRWLSVDAADPAERVDGPGGKRFNVSIQDDDGYAGCLYDGDDFNAALAVMRDPCATILPL